MENIRVRIAPSPTGFAHVGTAYTSLFNLAFAKKNNGKFILRLEDTDQKRNVSDAEQKIYDGLRWLGIIYDEGPDVGGEYGPYRQSERVDIYNPFVEKLLKSERAYESEGAVFLKVEAKDVEWNDLIRGKVVFPADQQKDLVIRKSDGFPTYHFAVVVDDHLMKISHVIRAEDHISNTPKQIHIYKALDFDIPEFAHTPLIRNSDKSKLSKRKNNVEIDWYRQEGYLPDALVNFLSLLGWSHPDGKEIFTQEEFVNKFSLDRIKKTGPVFDIKKLNWMNGEYIKSIPEEKLSELINQFYDNRFSDNLEKIIPLVKERISTLKEFESIAGFFYDDQISFDIDANKLLLNDINHIKEALAVIESIQNWELDTINDSLMNKIKDKEFNTGKFFMDLRIAITGKKVTPPINESIHILGKDKTLDILKVYL